MILVIHRACNGPAIETDMVEAEACALPVQSFPFPCFTCLEEITEEAELRYAEEMPM